MNAPCVVFCVSPYAFSWTTRNSFNNALLCRMSGRLEQIGFWVLTHEKYKHCRQHTHMTNIYILYVAASNTGNVHDHFIHSAHADTIFIFFRFILSSIYLLLSSTYSLITFSFSPIALFIVVSARARVQTCACEHEEEHRNDADATQRTLLALPTLLPKICVQTEKSGRPNGMAVCVCILAIHHWQLVQIERARISKMQCKKIRNFSSCDEDNDCFAYFFLHLLLPLVIWLMDLHLHTARSGRICGKKLAIWLWAEQARETAIHQ